MRRERMCNPFPPHCHPEKINTPKLLLFLKGKEIVTLQQERVNYLSLLACHGSNPNGFLIFILRKVQPKLQLGFSSCGLDK